MENTILGIKTGRRDGSMAWRVFVRTWAEAEMWRAALEAEVITIEPVPPELNLDRIEYNRLYSHGLAPIVRTADGLPAPGTDPPPSPFLECGVDPAPMWFPAHKKRSAKTYHVRRDKLGQAIEEDEHPECPECPAAESEVGARNSHCNSTAVAH